MNIRVDIPYQHYYYRACTEWTYDRSVFTNTIVQDFNLVCDRKSWKNVAQMVYFFGLIFGVFGAGLLSDKFGRKATLGPIGIALGTVGLITAAMPSVEAFVAIRGPIQWNTFLAWILAC